MYTPLSDIELVEQALQCFTVDGAYHKLAVLLLEREEYLEEILAYNKREQSESVVATSIANDQSDTYAHKLLAEYHLAELKTRVKFNRVRVETVRREIDTVSKLRELLKPALMHKDSNAKQMAAYDEFVLNKVWTTYTEFRVTGNQYSLASLRALPFDTSKLLQKILEAKEGLQPLELFEYLELSTDRVCLLEGSVLKPALPTNTLSYFPI